MNILWPNPASPCDLTCMDTVPLHKHHAGSVQAYLHFSLFLCSVRTHKHQKFYYMIIQKMKHNNWGNLTKILLGTTCTCCWNSISINKLSCSESLHVTTTTKVQRFTTVTKWCKLTFVDVVISTYWLNCERDKLCIFNM